MNSLERANPASADFDTQLEDTETTAEEVDFVTEGLKMTGASDENLEGLLDSVTILIEKAWWCQVAEDNI